MFAYQLFATSSAARIYVHICCTLSFTPHRKIFFVWLMKDHTSCELTIGRFLDQVDPQTHIS